jgi:hypothetical protein
VGETAIWRAVGAAFESNPVVLPAVLLLFAAGAIALARRRRRKPAIVGPRLQSAARAIGRAVIVGYLIIAVTSVGLAGFVVLERWQLFYGAHWLEPGHTLALERWGPIPDVSVARGDVLSVTEMSYPERTMFGHSRVIQYSLLMRSGKIYWSRTFADGRETDSMRELLLELSDRRMSRFIVGAERPAR